MSVNQKRTLTVIGMVVLGLLAARVIVGGTILSLLGGATGGLIAGIIFALMFREEIRKAAPEVVQAIEQVRGPNLEALRENLLKVEQQAALSGLSDALRARIAAFVDRLEPVMTGLAERFPGHQLTWEACRIAETRLGDLIMPYSVLSPESRVQKQVDFLATLTTLEGHLAKCEEVLKGSTELNMDTVAAGIKMQFETGTV